MFLPARQVFERWGVGCSPFPEEGMRGIISSIMEAGRILSAFQTFQALESHAMTSVTIEEAQRKLPDIVRQLQPGEEVTITDHERPVAQVRKATQTSWSCKAGSAKQSILRIAPDFDAPLDEFQEYME